MRACIADERSNELQRRRLLRRTSAHDPCPFSSASTERSCIARIYPQQISASHFLRFDTMPSQPSRQACSNELKIIRLAVGTPKADSDHIEA